MVKICISWNRRGKLEFLTRHLDSVDTDSDARGLLPHFSSNKDQSLFDGIDATVPVFHKRFRQFPAQIRFSTISAAAPYSQIIVRKEVFRKGKRFVAEAGKKFPLWPELRQTR